MESVCQLLLSHGHDVVPAGDGHTALTLGKDGAIDVALVDLLLDDIPGISVVENLVRDRPELVCVLVAESGSFENAIEALRAGACDLASKPLLASSLVDLIRRAELRLGARPSRASADLESHALRRWAALVQGATSLSGDPRTLAEWARGVAVSTGTLRNWCRTAGISARRSLWFARVLRAVHLSSGGSRRPQDVMNIVDKRTLSKVLLLAGGNPDDLPVSLEHFLRRQRLLENDEAIAVLRGDLHRAAVGGSSTRIESGSESLNILRQSVRSR